MTIIDSDTETGRILRFCFKFKRGKLDDKKRLASVLEFINKKIKTRYRDRIATGPTIQFFEYDADNFIKNLITVVFSYGYILFTNAH